LAPRGSESEGPAKLFELLSRGDPAACDLFYETTNGLLFGILLHILRNTQIAEAVLTNLYSEVRRSAGRFGKQKDQPLTWLVLITHRQGIERLCRELASQATGREVDNEHDDDLFINITQQRRVIRARLNMIPRSERRMLELAFFSGLSRSEIAKELGISCEAVDDSLRAVMKCVFEVIKSLPFSPSGAKNKSKRRVSGRRVHA
jgi:RNA polymerase sigma-70 factor (ECF subfamily)